MIKFARPLPPLLCDAVLSYEKYSSQVEQLTAYQIHLM